MTLKKQVDVRPKKFCSRNDDGSNSKEYILVDSLVVPDRNSQQEDSLDKKCKSLTCSPQTQRRGISMGGGISMPNPPPLRMAHSTTSFDRRNVKYTELDTFPNSKKDSKHKKRRASVGNICQKSKSTESMEMVDEFDPSGPLLASSRKSLCGLTDDNDGDSSSSNKYNNNKTGGDSKPVRTNIPASDTLVLNDDEYAQYVQLSQNMVLQHQVKVKMPFPAGSVIYIRGREVILAIALFFFLTLSLGLVAAITREKLLADKKSKGPTTHKPPPVNECTDNYCHTPQIMRELGDFSLDPCGNFWLYACSGWLRNNTIPKHQNSWDVSKQIEAKVDRRLKQLLENSNKTNSSSAGSGGGDGSSWSADKARIMYRQCMKPIDSTQNLDFVVKGLKGKNIFNDERKGINFEEGMDILKQVKWKYWTSVFFEVWVAPDDKLPDTMRIQFDQGGLNLGRADEYEEGPGTSKKISYYKDFMNKLSFPGINLDFVTTTFEFEQKLAQIHLPDGSIERENPDLQYNLVSVKNLTHLAPQVNWLEFLKEEFSSVTENTTVLITNENYFRNLSKLLKNTKFEVLKQYMLWSVVFKYDQELSPTLRSAAYVFRQAVEGLASIEERWKYCVIMVGDWLGAAVGAMYVTKYVTIDTIRQLEVMVSDMKEAFAKSLKVSKWMSNNTTTAAMEKLDKMSHIIGYPKFLLNDTVMKEIYKNFIVNPNDTFFITILNGIKNEGYLMDKQLQTHQFPLRPDVSPHAVTAFYTWSVNAVLLQAGILEPPHFQQEEGRVVNYGAIGSIIGHEMVHGFDNFGGMYDGEGALKPWWSVKSNKEYKRKLKCLVDQYSKYSLGGIHVNGQTTLGENMADIEGLKLAFKAWKKYESTHGGSSSTSYINGQHTSDQLFFIAFAQNMCGRRANSSQSALSVHSPAQIRVKGSLSNMEEFSTAFNCPAGSPFNPRNKCSVWD